jgi:hypothetical protein
VKYFFSCAREGRRRQSQREAGWLAAAAATHVLDNHDEERQLDA